MTQKVRYHFAGEEAAFENCVSERLEAYPEMTHEEAEALCKAEMTSSRAGASLGIRDRDATPLERCMSLRMDIYGEDETVAKETCKTLLTSPLIKKTIIAGKPRDIAMVFHEWDMKPDLTEEVKEQLDELEEKPIDFERIEADAEANARRYAEYAKARRFIYGEDIVTSFEIAKLHKDSEDPFIQKEIDKLIEMLHDYESCLDVKVKIYGMDLKQAEHLCSQRFGKVKAEMRAQPFSQGLPSGTQPEATPLERCIANRMQVHNESEDKARQVCEALIQDPNYQEFMHKQDMEQRSKGMTVGNLYGLTKKEILERQRS